MSLYTIAQFIDQTGCNLKVASQKNLDIETYAKVAPAWIMNSQTENRIALTISIETPDGYHFQNDIEIWCVEDGSDNYLNYQTSLDGSNGHASNPIPKKIPKNGGFLSVTLLMFEDTIIVGTVDAMIEPDPISVQ